MGPRACFLFAPPDIHVPRLVVPGGNLVAPPQLPRNAPVLDVVDPVMVGCEPFRWHEAHPLRCPAARRHDAGTHRLEAQVLDRLAREVRVRGRRRLGQRHEPLVGQHRLDHLARASAARHHHLVRLLRHHEASRREVGQHRLARRIAIEPAIILRRVIVHRGIEIEDGERRQPVSLPELPVVEIMRRRDLDGAGAELAINVVVGHDRDGAASQRQRHLFADERAVALIVGIDRHRHVTQHGFRPGRRDDDGLAILRVDQRIADLPELALLLFAVDLEIGYRGAELGVPVDEALAAVDEAVVVKTHEGLEHRRRESSVHRKALARPVSRVPQPTHLLRDRRPGFLLPLPHPVVERRAAEVVARFPLRLQLLLDHDLGCNAGMIGTHLPKRVIATHAVIADHQIHQRVLERVPHVQRAGHIGRRELDAERRGARLHRRLEEPVRFPEWIPLRLDGVRFEAFGEIHDGRSGGDRRDDGLKT